MPMTRHENEARSSYVESGAQSYVTPIGRCFVHGSCTDFAYLRGAAAAFGRRGEATDHPLGTMGMRKVPKARRRGHLVFRGCFRGKIFAALFTAARRSAAPAWWRPSVFGWRLWSRGWRPCPFAARPLAARAAADASGDVDEARLARLLRRLCTHQFHCPSLQIHQRPCQALAARL